MVPVIRGGHERVPGLGSPATVREGDIAKFYKLLSIRKSTKSQYTSVVTRRAKCTPLLRESVVQGLV